MEARLAAVEQAEGGGEKHSAACAQRMPQLRVYQLLIRAMCAMRMHAALTSQGAKQGPQQAGRKSLGGALRACKLLRSTLRRFKGAPGTFDALQARLFCTRSCRRRRCRPAAMLPVVPTACSTWCSSCPCNLHQKCTLLLLNQKSAIMYSRWPLGAGHLDCAQRSQERQHMQGCILVLLGPFLCWPCQGWDRNQATPHGSPNPYWLAKARASKFALELLAAATGSATCRVHHRWGQQWPSRSHARASLGQLKQLWDT